MPEGLINNQHQADDDRHRVIFISTGCSSKALSNLISSIRLLFSVPFGGRTEHHEDLTSITLRGSSSVATLRKFAQTEFTRSVIGIQCQSRLLCPSGCPSVCLAYLFDRRSSTEGRDRHLDVRHNDDANAHRILTMTVFQSVRSDSDDDDDESRDSRLFCGRRGRRRIRSMDSSLQRRMRGAQRPTAPPPHPHPCIRRQRRCSSSSRGCAMHCF